MTEQSENAVQRYQKSLEKSLTNAPLEVKTDAIQDAEEFLRDETRAMDVGSLTSEDLVFQRLVQRFGMPEQLALSYIEQTSGLISGKITGRWKRAAVMTMLLFLATGGICYAMLREPPKLSPFTNVMFEGDQVLVTYGGKVYQWLELDHLTVKEIVASAKKQFDDRWRERIAEDLIEVLWGMEHRPGNTVRLCLLSSDGKSEHVVEEALLTYENRQAVWTRQLEAEEKLASQVLADPISYFHQGLRERWAYYSFSADAIDSAVMELRKQMSEGQAKIDLPLEFQRVLANGIDGHANARGWFLAGRCLPFLIEPVGGRYVAFDPNRKSFVDADHPYIESIDDVPLTQWCIQSAMLVAQGTNQMIQQRSCRLLRHIDHWRNVRGMPTANSLRVKLTSASHDSSIEITVPTIDNKPIYGDWPRQQSRVIEKNIGYLRLPSMDNKAVADIRTYMATFKDTQGIIVDVRGNGGGSRDALRWLFSYLLSHEDTPRVVNAAKYRLFPDFFEGHLEARFMYPADSNRWSQNAKSAITKFAKNFRAKWDPPANQFSDWHYMVLDRLDHSDIYHYKKPIVVLSDANCFSATDIFLAGLKGWKNVTLIGTPSSGGSARSVAFDLPGTRLRFRLASMASFQPDGKLYDGNGVIPDQIIEPTANYFIGKSDRVLDEGIRIIAQ